MPPQTKEWTLIFYFASDNPLAPSTVSQLKAIKQAGFHPEANVVVQFDPHTEGTPTHVFDVNLVEKLKAGDKANVGFASNDPFVRKLMDDKLWRGQKDRHGKLIKERIGETLKGTLAPGRIYAPPEPPPDRNEPAPGEGGEPEELGPRKSLEKFLKFCSDYYPARHYALFVIGHGLVVGNDVFLYDEHGDEHSLSLIELGGVLSTFKRDLAKRGAEFELIGFHSCSVSSLEVAYELQGTANYMLASQGPAFVGSWPYRQILIRVFNDLEKLRQTGEKIDVKEMLGKIFSYCVHNSADFMLAGYSFDLCLCNLKKVPELQESLRELSGALIEGLSNALVRDFILLAHWKAQSFWQESYTDLYDFCLCLSNRCEEYELEGGPPLGVMKTVREACVEVMKRLVKERPPSPHNLRPGDDNFIIRAEFAGPAYQYAHGQSIFFPWAEPTSDSPVMANYRRYKFNETAWHTFLERYFVETLRQTRQNEREPEALRPRVADMRQPGADDELLEDMASLVYHREGASSTGNTLSDPPPPRGKVNPRDLTGEDCSCTPIKNYPRDLRPREDRARQADAKTAPVSETFSS